MSAFQAIRKKREVPWPFAALIVLSIGLVWLLPYFPTQDGPSHLYNIAILHDLINGGTIWGEYFTYDLRATPNLGFHAVAYPLLTFFSPLVTEKIFISLYILLMTVSVPCFLRSFGNRSMPLSYLVFPLLFNYAFMMGFYSFSLAVPCMLLSIALAWSLRARPLLQRALVFNLSGFILFYLHLIPFSIYILFLFIMPMVTANGFRNKCRELFLIITVTSPCLLNALLFLLQAPMTHGTPPSYTISLTRFGELAVELLLFSLDTFAVWQLAPWAGLAVMIYAMIRAPRTHQPDFVKNRDARLCVMLLLLSLTLVYFLAPNNFAGGSLFNQRLPWVLFLLLLPLLTVPDTGFLARYQGRLFPGLALIFLLVNGVVMRGESLRIEEFLAGMKLEIPKGTLISTYKEPNSSWSRIDPLLHAASYYGMEKGCVDAGNYEAATPLFPVRFRAAAPRRPRTDRIEYFPSLIDWGKYPAIQYLLGWEVVDEGRKKLEENFTLIMEKRRFTLWQRRLSGGIESRNEERRKAGHEVDSDHTRI
jgi:hypothetical protein